MVDKNDHADAGWDDYAERVLRNEGRLQGLEILVAETREADRKLIEQRSESLARELERRADSLLELVTARADAVLALGKEEREADRREVAVWKNQHDAYMTSAVESIRREGEITLNLLREMYDTAIRQIRQQITDDVRHNFEQSQAAIHDLELRRQAATEKVEQMVRQWRESDREAREIFARDTARHLEQLNHNNERMANFQNNSVTRELWQSEKDAAIKREGLLRDQIIALDRTMLTMTPISQSEKAHVDITGRMERSIAAASEVLDNKIMVVNDKVSELKAYRDTTQGVAVGRSTFFAWGVSAITVVISIVVLANAFIGK